jgi:small subunit ribosomal protein S5
LGSTNAVNLALATLKALKDLVPPDKAARLRDLGIGQIIRGAKKGA